jgi:hypothetical protein
MFAEKLYSFANLILAACVAGGSVALIDWAAQNFTVRALAACAAGFAAMGCAGLSATMLMESLFGDWGLLWPAFGYAGPERPAAGNRAGTGWAPGKRV